MAVIANKNNEDQNQQNGVNNPAPAGTNAPMSSSAPAAGGTTQASAASPGGRPEQKGSGRFTNIQKYLDANQGGADRIAGQIGSNVKKDFEKNTQQYTKYQNQLDQTQAQAAEAAQRGLGYNQNLQNIGNTIEAAKTAGFNQRDAQGQALGQAFNQFTQSPDFNDFRNIQTGRAIDESLLSLQQQKALQTAKQATQTSQGVRDALGNEGGRFELLRKTFGGDARAGYGQGQQRLDNMLFSQGGGAQELQNIANEQLRKDQQLLSAAAGEANEVSQLASQERGLLENINNTALDNETKYLNLLESYKDPLNKVRTNEWNSVNKAIKSYADGTTGSDGLTKEQMDRLGLKSDMGAYGVFSPGRDADTFLKQGAQAKDYRDVANENDVQRYNALAKILGDNHQKKITQASQIGESYRDRDESLGEGKGLKQQLTEADQRFWNEVGSKELTGSVRKEKEGQDQPWWDTSFQPIEYDTSATKAKIADLIRSGNAGFQDTGSNKYTDSARQKVIDQFLKEINKANYKQTLGGSRDTLVEHQNSDVNDNPNRPITGGAGKGGAPAPVKGTPGTKGYKG